MTACVASMALNLLPTAGLKIETPKQVLTDLLTESWMFCAGSGLCKKDCGHLQAVQ